MWKLDICVNHLTKCQLLEKVIPFLGIKSALKKVNTNIKRWYISNFFSQRYVNGGWITRTYLFSLKRSIFIPNVKLISLYLYFIYAFVKQREVFLKEISNCSTSPLKSSPKQNPGLTLSNKILRWSDLLLLFTYRTILVAPHPLLASSCQWSSPSIDRFKIEYGLVLWCITVWVKFAHNSCPITDKIKFPLLQASSYANNNALLSGLFIAVEFTPKKCSYLPF